MSAQRTDPLEKSNQDPAEASRETINNPTVNDGRATDNPMERGSGQPSDPHKPIPRPGGKGAAQPAAGITNRPLEEEQATQNALPDRGKTRNK